MTKTYNILATTLLTLAMMIAVGMLTSCNIEIVKNDDKNDETKVFNVKEFSRIEASVGASIIYSASDTTEVKVVSSKRQIDRLDIETKDGVLYIGFKNEKPNGGRIVINNRSKGICKVVSPSAVAGTRWQVSSTQGSGSPRRLWSTTPPRVRSSTPWTMPSVPTAWLRSVPRMSAVPSPRRHSLLNGYPRKARSVQHSDKHCLQAHQQRRTTPSATHSQGSQGGSMNLS